MTFKLPLSPASAANAPKTCTANLAPIDDTATVTQLYDAVLCKLQFTFVATAVKSASVDSFVNMAYTAKAAFVDEPTVLTSRDPVDCISTSNQMLPR